MLGPLLIPDLVIFFLTIILVYLTAKRTSKNNYYLKWLIGSLLMQVFTLIWLRLSLVKVVDQEYLNFFTIGRGLSLLLLTIHIQSLINGREEKLKKTDKIAFVLFAFFIMTFNLGVRLFKEPFIGRYLLNIELNADSPSKEVIMLWLSYLIFLFIRVYQKCLKNVLNTNQLERPWLYLFWIIGYFLFIGLSSSISFLLVFGVKISFIENLHIGEIFSVLAFVFVILNPSILFYIPGPSQFSIINPSIRFELQATFIDLIDKKNIYLKPRLSLNDFSVLCESNPIDIRNYILAQTGLNFNDYINGYRVLHSASLMNKGYLKSHSIYALGEECGFNSHQSFFRAFRKVHNTSPAKYYKLQISETSALR